MIKKLKEIEIERHLLRVIMLLAILDVLLLGVYAVVAQAPSKAADPNIAVEMTEEPKTTIREEVYIPPVHEDKVEETIETPVVEVETTLDAEVTEEVEEQPWYTQEELDLLARLIYFEARGECYEGQVAVGAVVMNRMKSAGFPNTIEGVIYQKNQFSPVKSSKWNDEITNYGTVYEAAIEALNGVDPTNGALYFYNPKISTSEWIFTRTVVKVIGNHNFAI